MVVWWHVCVFRGAFAKVPDMLKQGLVKMADVDRAVGNVLRQKFAAGLFDKNDTLLYVDAARHQAVVGAAPHRELARTVAEEGVTLLKNDRLRLPLLGLGKDIKDGRCDRPERRQSALAPRYLRHRQAGRWRAYGSERDHCRRERLGECLGRELRSRFVLGWHARLPLLLGS